MSATVLGPTEKVTTATKAGLYIRMAPPKEPNYGKEPTNGKQQRAQIILVGPGEILIGGCFFPAAARATVADLQSAIDRRVATILEHGPMKGPDNPTPEKAADFARGFYSWVVELADIEGIDRE